MKTKIITNRNFSNDYKFKSEGLDSEEDKSFFTDASVLIPDSLHQHFCNQVNSIGDGDYFNSLLKKYRTLLKLYSAKKKLNTDYQVQNLELHKENIRVEEVIWAELKMWKAYLNWSVCKIVTFLVELDFAGIAEEIPEEVASLINPKIPKFFLESKMVFSTRISTFARRFKISRFDYE